MHAYKDVLSCLEKKQCVLIGAVMHRVSLRRKSEFI